MDDAGAPFPVVMAAFVGFANALFLGIMGLVGFLSWNEVGDPFGVGVLLAGVAFAAGSLLALRGSQVGLWILALLCGLITAVGIFYALTGPTSAIAPALVAAAVPAGVLALLFLPKASQRHFGRA